MKKYLSIVVVVIFCGLAGHTQSKLILRVKELRTLNPVRSATIAEGVKVLGATDSLGFFSIVVTNMPHTIEISSVGYSTITKKLVPPFTDTVLINMQPNEESLTSVVVSSTRNNQRIENAPLKVEVLGREEMDEENTIKPGNIASIIGDISGIQIQQSSAVSANANVRIQGLEGRYTQILKDGMPLYDAFSGGFGILTIPPLDLRQIELIKGSASTLYGGGAIGGLINIISRRPTVKQDAVFTINQSTLKETNFNTYLAKRQGHFGYTFFGGYTHNTAVDVNKDGFSDVPDLNTFLIHPRLFFYPDSRTTIITGYTGTFEKRKGGDMLVLNNKTDQNHQYFENNKTGRHTGEFVVEHLLSTNARLDLKANVSAFDRTINTNTYNFRGKQLDYYTEFSAYVPYAANSFVAGVNVTGSSFKILPSDPVILRNFSNNTIGAFAQNTWSIKDKTTLELGLRDDYTNNYGNFILPRAALFHRFNEHWGTRFGVGMGYKTPDPLSPQIKDYDINMIHAMPANIKAEKSVGYNAELNYKTHWDNGNEIFVNHAFFLTSINDPVIGMEASDGTLSFSNASKVVISKGFDTYIRTVIHQWELYAGYTYTIAERKYLTSNQFMPLTPRNRMAFTIVRDWEGEGWRVGLEGSYTGSQNRLDATKTPGYMFMAAMIEKRFGNRLSLVLNVENLLDYRQSRVESLYTGAVAAPDFKPLWAPIDGRVINLSLRFRLFH